MENLFWLKWQRCHDRYRIEGDKSWRTIEPVSAAMDTYFPFDSGIENRQLFMVLANAEQTENGALKFANDYGLLIRSASTGGSVAEFISAVKQMHAAVTAWRAGDLSAVREIYNGWKLAQVEIELVRQGGNAGLHLRFEFKELIAAIWFQFAQAVAENRQITICENCGLPFAHGAGTGRRKHAIYCSPKCQRIHSYKLRKEASK